MNIFTYGSLMFPSVMKAVTGREFPSKKARLRDYARFKVRGESFPGLTPVKGALTDGVLYSDVDPLSVRRLDDFEGDLYQRTEIRVQVEERESLTAQTYVIRPRHRDRLSSQEWDPDHFEKADLIEFMASYPGFVSTATPFRGETDG